MSIFLQLFISHHVLCITCIFFYFNTCEPFYISCRHVYSTLSTFQSSLINCIPAVCYYTLPHVPGKEIAVQISLEVSGEIGPCEFSMFFKIIESDFKFIQERVDLTLISRRERNVQAVHTNMTMRANSRIPYRPKT